MSVTCNYPPGGKVDYPNRVKQARDQLQSDRTFQVQTLRCFRKPEPCMDTHQGDVLVDILSFEFLLTLVLVL